MRPPRTFEIALLIAMIPVVTTQAADEGRAPAGGGRARLARALDPSAGPRWVKSEDSFSYLLRKISDNTPRTAFETNDSRTLPKVVQRAARKALGTVLRDTTGLSDLFHHESENRSSLSSSGSADDRVRFRVGASHLAPKVEMRCPTAGGALGVSLGARGQLAMDLSPTHASGARFHAGYDRSSRRFDVLFRLSY